jgi:hypothetical protein
VEWKHCDGRFLDAERQFDGINAMLLKAQKALKTNTVARIGTSSGGRRC